MYIEICRLATPDSDNKVAVEANVRSTLCQNQHRATQPFIRAVDFCRYV